MKIIPATLLLCLIVSGAVKAQVPCYPTQVLNAGLTRAGERVQFNGVATSDSDGISKIMQVWVDGASGDFSVVIQHGARACIIIVGKRFSAVDTKEAFDERQHGFDSLLKRGTGR